MNSVVKICHAQSVPTGCARCGLLCTLKHSKYADSGAWPSLLVHEESPIPHPSQSGPAPSLSRLGDHGNCDQNRQPCALTALWCPRGRYISWPTQNIFLTCKPSSCQACLRPACELVISEALSGDLTIFSPMVPSRESARIYLTTHSCMRLPNGQDPPSPEREVGSQL